MEWSRCIVHAVLEIDSFAPKNRGALVPAGHEACVLDRQAAHLESGQTEQHFYLDDMFRALQVGETQL